MRLASEQKIADYHERGWWADRTLHDAFMNAVNHRGDALAAVDPPNRPDFFGGAPRRVTWRTLADETETMARILNGRGLKRGDRLLMQMPNVVEVIPLYMACAKLGIIISPLPVQYGGHEIGHAVETLSPKVMIAATRFKDRPLAELSAERFAGRLEVWTMGTEGVPGRFDLSKAVQEGLRETHPPVPSASTADDCFTVVWTSGTTGMPKGVPRSHNHWLAIAPATYDGMGLVHDDIILNPFPLTNMAAIGGMLCSWLHVQGRLILHHPFDLPIFLQQLVGEGVTATVAPPALLTMLLKQEAMLNGLDLSKLRVIGSGSAPLSEFMVKGWHAREIAIVNLFGSNEGLSLVTGPREAPDPARRAKWFPRFGYARADFENTMHGRVSTKLVSVAADSVGRPITQPGEAGELLVKGPAVFEGYWGMTEDERRRVFDDEGFFRTGDLFSIAEDDRFFEFRGRAKDIIIRGGVNISAAELDTLLEGHPKLAEAAVYGVPDEVMGERVAVAAVPKPGETVTLEDIIEYLRAQSIASHKLPERLRTIDALPRNPMNKVLRFKLTEEAS